MKITKEIRKFIEMSFCNGKRYRDVVDDVYSSNEIKEREAEATVDRVIWDMANEIYE